MSEPFRIEFKGEFGNLEYKTFFSVGADIPAQPWRPDPILDESLWNAEEWSWKIPANGRCMLPTGIRIVDVDYDALDKWKTAFGMQCIPSFHILPRSGLSKMGLVASIGTIEVDYENFEMFVCLENHTQQDVDIKVGTRVGQLKCGIALRALGIPVRQAIREGGFGSTGL